MLGKLWATVRRVRYTMKVCRVNCKVSYTMVHYKVNCEIRNTMGKFRVYCKGIPLIKMFSKLH
jgi:hypothetical protein